MKSKKNFYKFSREYMKNIKNKGISLPLSEKMKIIGHLWQISKIIKK